MNLKITNGNKHFSQAPEVSNQKSDAEKAKLAKASKDFESLLTSMMIKSMTSTTEGLFGDSEFGGDAFQSMFESEIASDISEKKGLGIAEKIYKQLTGEDLNKFELNSAKDRLLNFNKPEKSESVDKIETKENSPVEKINIKSHNYNNSVVPSEKSLSRIENYEDIISEASEKFGVDKNIIKSVVLAESAGNAKATSHAKAKGLMQLLDGTAKDMGVKNIWDPKQNIFGGTKYLSGLLRQYNGDLKLALAAYNAGPGNVAKHNGIPPFKETKNYISRVMGYLNYLNG